MKPLLMQLCLLLLFLASVFYSDWQITSSHYILFDSIAHLEPSFALPANSESWISSWECCRSLEIEQDYLKMCLVESTVFYIVFERSIGKCLEYRVTIWMPCSLKFDVNGRNCLIMNWASVKLGEDLAI